MQAPIFLNRDDVTEAEMLIRSFGRGAGLEAAERAESSRNQGNTLHFCRWRQIERLIVMLSVAGVNRHGALIRRRGCAVRTAAPRFPVRPTSG